MNEIAMASGAARVGAPSPVTLSVRSQETYDRRLPLVKWLLAAPHYVALIFLEIGLLFAWFAAALAVLVSGRYPEGLYTFVSGAARWLVRVTAYLLLLTDEYPPFATYARPGDAVRLDLEAPDGRIARWRPLAAWILVLPQYVVLAFAYLGLLLTNLIALCSIVTTGTFPPPLFDYAERTLRFHARTNAYAFFMTDRYPGFEL